MINVIHYTIWSAFHQAHFQCNPIWIRRPYRLTVNGAQRMLRHYPEYDKPTASVTRVEVLS